MTTMLHRDPLTQTTGAGTSAAGAIAPILPGRAVGTLFSRPLAKDEPIELRFAVTEADRRGVLAALGPRPVDAEVRQVAFVDRLDLRLLRGGLLVEVRRPQRGATTIVVTRAPAEGRPTRADAPGGPGVGLLAHVAPVGLEPAFTMAQEIAARDARDLLAGHEVQRHLFGAGQLALLAGGEPTEVLPDALVVLGPIHVLRRTYVPRGCRVPITATLAFLPDGGRALEISTVSTAAHAWHAAGELRRFAHRAGAPTADRRTSTRAVLAALVAARGVR